MSEANPFLIGDEVGVTPQINGLLGMLRYARTTTLRAVSGLSVGELDHRHDAGSNSIGSLLLHMAAAEAWYQANSFDNREWTPAESARWEVALDLGPAAESIRGFDLAHYVAILSEVRTRTDRELRTRDDVWLASMSTLSGGTVNNFWKWFHVCEDEVNHRGQIRWLRKRLPDVSSAPPTR